MTKNVVLEPMGYNIVKEIANNRGLGRNGFSAALRQILGVWAELISHTQIEAISAPKGIDGEDFLAKLDACII